MKTAIQITIQSWPSWIGVIHSRTSPRQFSATIAACFHAVNPSGPLSVPTRLPMAVANAQARREVAVAAGVRQNRKSADAAISATNAVHEPWIQMPQNAISRATEAHRNVALKGRSCNSRARYFQIHSRCRMNRQSAGSAARGTMSWDAV